MDPIVHLLHKVAAGKSNPVVVTNIGSKIFDLFQIFVYDISAVSCVIFVSFL